MRDLVAPSNNQSVFANELRRFADRIDKGEVRAVRTSPWVKSTMDTSGIGRDDVANSRKKWALSKNAGKAAGYARMFGFTFEYREAQ